MKSLRYTRLTLSEPWRTIALVVATALLADLSFRVRPTNYFGGSTDDQRYLEAALSWLAHGPHAGTTHWSLRHPLILSIVMAFDTFGISLDALQLVSRLYADLLIAVTAAFLARAASLRVAALWIVLALSSPILHEMATSCFPEMLELMFSALSLWLFREASGRTRWSGELQLASGLALATAVLTRETAIGLLGLYAYVWARGQVRPTGAIWFAAGFAPLIMLDIGWLWFQTGDPLYRLHVDESHIGIYSDHLRGGIYHGRAFLNPDLASRWLPSGPVRLHWAIDPILNFFADPHFGLAFAGWAALALAKPTRPAAGTLAARVMPALLAIALISYFVVTWALTLRPQPRYYLVAVYAATIALALLGAQVRLGSRARRLQRICIGLVVLCGTITISLAPDRQRDARVLLPWLKKHPDAIVHLEPKDAGRIAFPAILAGTRWQISGAAPSVGMLRARLLLDPGDPRAERVDPNDWKAVAILPEPRLFPYINPARRMVIERRLR